MQYITIYLITLWYNQVDFNKVISMYQRRLFITWLCVRVCTLYNCVCVCVSLSLSLSLSLCVCEPACPFSSYLLISIYIEFIPLCTENPLYETSTYKISNSLLFISLLNLLHNASMKIQRY